MYDSLLVDQSLGLNRRCDDEADVKTEVQTSQIKIKKSPDTTNTVLRLHKSEYLLSCILKHDGGPSLGVEFSGRLMGTIHSQLN